MQKFLIGYDIAGHLLIEAPNSGAAAATAIGIIASTARSLEAHGENEYRCPSGRPINLSSVSPAKAKDAR